MGFEYRQKKSKSCLNNLDRRPLNTFKNFSSSLIIIDNLLKNIRERQYYL